MEKCEINNLKLLSKYRTPIMGFAALWIFVFHEWHMIFNEGSKLWLIERFLKMIGFCGVDIFFFLSGIGLVFSIQKSGILSFYINRVKRIFVPVLAVAIGRSILEKWSLGLFLKNITGYNFYAENIYSFLWFVPAILTVYLLFPLYYHFFKRAQDKRIFTFIVLAIWLILAVSLAPYLRYDLYGFINRIPIILYGIYTGWKIQNLTERDSMNRGDWILTILLLMIGLILANATNFHGMSIIVPISNCCLPNFLIAVSLPLLLAKCLDLLKNSAVHAAGKGIEKFFGLWGLMSLEFYCLQEWIAGLLTDAAPGLGPKRWNLYIFLIVTVMGLLLYLINKLIWSFIEKIIQKFHQGCT